MENDDPDLAAHPDSFSVVVVTDTGTRDPKLQPVDGPRSAVDHRYDIIATLEDLDRRADDWKGLHARVRSPMETFGWARACTASFGEAGEVWTAVVWGGHDPIAIAPLLKVRTGLVRRLVMPGLTTLDEPTDLVYADEVSAHALVEVLLKEGLPFTLGRLPGDSMIPQAVRKALAGRGIILSRTREGYPYITLDSTWAEPERKVSSRRRSDMRRARRRAEQLGSVEMEILAPGPDEVDEQLAVAVRVESRSWKGEEGTSMANDARLGTFFRWYARHAASEGILRTAFMRIGADVAAVQIGVIHDDRFWLLKVGYDPQFHRASPGILIMNETIRYAATNRLVSYEMLGSAEAWTKVWTEDERPCLSLRVYPRSPRGMMALAMDGVSKVSERLFKGGS